MDRQRKPKHKYSIVLASIAVALLLTLNARIIFGQKVNAQVEVNLEQLYQDKQLELQNFATVIQHYIEFSQWPEAIIPYEIGMKIQIVIDRIRPSFEDVFSVRLFIASDATGFKEVDRRWRFPYQKNQILTFNPAVFDSLTGLLNFYIFIAIGEYLDRLETYGGESFFEKAQDIAILGQSNRYNQWWDKREEFVRLYLRESHEPFRAMTAAFDAALYWLIEKNEEEREIAADAAIELLKKVVQDPSEEKFFKDFLTREYSKLAAIFAPDSARYASLMEIDPDHKEFYINFISK